MEGDRAPPELQGGLNGDSQTSSRRVAAIAALATVVAGTSAAFGATGLKSYEGSDYSQDLYTAGAVKACDMEADGRDVYAEYTVLGSGTVQTIWDSNGANNACESSGDYGDYQIYKHRILENYSELRQESHRRRSQVYASARSAVLNNPLGVDPGFSGQRRPLEVPILIGDGKPSRSPDHIGVPIDPEGSMGTPMSRCSHVNRTRLVAPE